ncbi:hypothetical protein GCM10010166_38720 [Couchioplanes caeruleus subsp. azureus]|nr:hypothetical protein GCM10010166_38720 [Couchioplanes caeruleus subsp. azureus]
MSRTAYESQSLAGAYESHSLVPSKPHSLAGAHKRHSVAGTYWPHRGSAGRSCAHGVGPSGLVAALGLAGRLSGRRG